MGKIAYLPYILFLLISFLFVFALETLAAMEFKIDSIENNPSTINYDQQIKVLFSFKNVSGEKTYYIQGAFKEENNSRYFGWTKNDRGDYYKYEETNCQNFYKFDIKESSASGSILVKPDSDSSNFVGTSNYILKLYRFTDLCKSKTDSDNSLALKINGPPSPSPSPSLSPSPSPLILLSSSPSLIASIIPSKKPSPFPSIEEKINEASFSGEILGEVSSPSAQLSANSQPNNAKFLLPLIISFIGIILLVISGYSLIKAKAIKAED